MGSGSHLKRPWDDSEHEESQHSHAGAGAGASASVVGSGRRFSIDLTAPLEPRLPPILGPHESLPQVQREHSWTASVEPEDTFTCEASPRQPTEGSAKRPRLFYDQKESTNAERFDYKSSTANSSASESNELRLALAPRPVHGVEDVSVFRDTPCGNCSDTEELIQKVVSGLVGLEAEIRHVLALSKRHQDEEARNATHPDLRSSLLWACGSIETSTYLLKEGATNRPGLSLPPIEVANTLEHPDLASVPGGLSKHLLDVYEKDRTDDYNRRYNLTSHGFYPSRLPDLTPPSTMSDLSRKGFCSDQIQSQSAHSPSHSGSGSTYASGQSPMQTQGPYRTLPSPSSINYPSSASGLPAAYSPTMNQSVHSAHLQDLQHQISTKTLALQTLQREHDQLLGAFSRSQIRCSTLDKKSQVSDHEINSLTEEKIRLQAQVEALETQVEDLIKAKDELHSQTTANTAQWRQIVSMSSQLQAQGAEEAKRYKSDREAWERDRDGLQRRIAELESGRLTLADTSCSAGSAFSNPSGDILTSTSLETLRAEIVRLRSKCADMEVALLDLRRVTERMDQVMGEFADIRERINVQTRHGLHGPGQPESRDEGRS